MQDRIGKIRAETTPCGRVHGRLAAESLASLITDLQIAGSDDQIDTETDRHRQTDVRSFVRMLSPRKLFKDIPGSMDLVSGKSQIVTTEMAVLAAQPAQPCCRAAGVKVQVQDASCCTR